MNDIGIDTDGVPRKLGDIDSDGYTVGYIYEDGSCYRDEIECWVCRCGGRYLDAWNDWRRAGRPGPAPDLNVFLTPVPEHLRAPVMEGVCIDVETHEVLLAFTRKTRRPTPGGI